jgi:hypothetical protein
MGTKKLGKKAKKAAAKKTKLPMPDKGPKK